MNTYIERIKAAIESTEWAAADPRAVECWMRLWHNGTLDHLTIHKFATDARVGAQLTIEHPTETVELALSYGVTIRPPSPTGPVTIEEIVVWISEAQRLLDEHRQQNYPNNPRYMLSWTPGRRYARIVCSRDNGQDRCVHCFIDMLNGDVLKADGWKGPAKGARGNIRSANPLAGINAFGANYR